VKLEAKKMTAIATAVSATALAEETNNPKETVIIPRRSIMFQIKIKIMD
jgi:hypothetical protein